MVCWLRLLPDFQLTGADFTGQLVIGNSPVQNLSWTRQLWGFGVYSQEWLLKNSLPGNPQGI